MNVEQTLAQQHYEKVGIGRRMGFGKRPCILVVDFQKGLTSPKYPLGANLDKEIAATRELLDVARQKKVPIIFTRTVYDDSGTDGLRYVDKIPSLLSLRKGTFMGEIDERLEPRPTESIVEKQYQSAFFGTPVLSILNSLHVDTAIICGCVTSGCIRATVIDSMQLGYYTIIPRQCVGDRASGPHESNLFDLDTKIADVVDKEEVIEYLNKLAPER